MTPEDSPLYTKERSITVLPTCINILESHTASLLSTLHSRIKMPRGTPAMWCRWKPRWSVVLSVLGLGWVFATSVTAFGMYMIACNSSSAVPPKLLVNPYEEMEMEKGMQTLRLQPGLVPFDEEGGVEVVSGGSVGCTWRWSVKQGQLVLAGGSLLNVFLLLLLLCFLILERRYKIQPLPPDPPPDYDTVMKEETPPPSFSDLLVTPTPSSSSSSSSTPTPTPTPTPTDAEATTPLESSLLVCLVVEEAYPPPYTP
ncbi:hypothetical protein Pcinc_027915 [Petrolisthes cinctipes]|uniref:Uncharacterized protein n=1 Tax=Petrolisthes cinctipes TaxID=88211 RepID=A0AAE1K619_PETCI|nr:hypothetical protein Pcinc_027915 [Petrolisthes cinctipes]